MSKTIADSPIEELVRDALAVHDYFWEKYNSTLPVEDKAGIQQAITNMLTGVPIDGARMVVTEMIRQYLVDIKADIS